MSDVMIGNVELDVNLRLNGIETADDLAMSTMVSFDGTTDVFTMPAQDKRLLTLVAEQNGNRIGGYYTLAQVEAIKSIAAARQPVVLKHHRGTFNVLIVSTAGITPVFNYRDPQADTKFVGPLLLQEV